MKRLAAAILVIAFHSSALAGEIEGRKAFEPCLSCHSMEPEYEGLPGPSLSGLIGRRVGGDPKFDYSPVLRTANEEGQVWSPALLETFLKDPEGMFPGMWMSYPGIRDPRERAALVRYITAPDN